MLFSRTKRITARKSELDNGEIKSRKNDDKAELELGYCAPGYIQPVYCTMTLGKGEIVALKNAVGRLGLGILSL